MNITLRANRRKSMKVVPLTGNTLQEIPLDKIVEDPFMPRKSYSDETLAGLGDSMDRLGLMQSVIVSRRDDGRFSLIVGSRRVRAARAKGYTHIPGMISDVTHPRDVMILALAENVQREELEPMEEANAYLWLCQENGMSIPEVAARIDKPVGHVRTRLKLLDLALPVQEMVSDERLAPTTAAALAHIQSGESQVAIAREAVQNSLSATEVRTRVREEELRPIDSKAARKVSVQKYRLGLLRFKEKIEQYFNVVEKLPMTPEERGRLMNAHLELEDVSMRIRNRISAAGRVASIPMQPRKGSGNVPTARNHGDEWPAGHLKLLENASLTDEDVMNRTGRTATAIRAMRRLHAKKKRLT